MIFLRNKKVLNSTSLAQTFTICCSASKRGGKVEGVKLLGYV